MWPKDCALLVVRIAKDHPISDQPNAATEVIYVLTWYLWDLLDEEAPEWTEALGIALDDLRVGITSDGSHERFAAYSEAKANQDGGGPALHIARTFQTNVLDVLPLDIKENMDVSLQLAAMMHGIRRAVLREA